MLLFLLFIFFFSSRRRHTRLVSDWSSDVCSSDLIFVRDTCIGVPNGCSPSTSKVSVADDGSQSNAPACCPSISADRSEERRVGKECRCRWSADQYKKNAGARDRKLRASNDSSTDR